MGFHGCEGLSRPFPSILATSKTLPSWRDAVHPALMLCFMIAGWNIMKMEEKNRV